MTDPRDPNEFSTARVVEDPNDADPEPLEDPLEGADVSSDEDLGEFPEDPKV